MTRKIISTITALLFIAGAFADTKHGATSAHTTINGKILCGYQGWFATRNDGSDQKWKHYSTDTQRLGQVFEPGACSIDMWPDMREYTEQYPTAFTSPDGTPATAFSSYKMSSSRLHFRWMEEYAIDGVILQRFVSNIRNSGSLRNFNDTVMVHTMKSAKEYNKAVCIMYDMTSMRSADTTSVKADWKRLVDTYKITSGGDDQPYLYHKGKPLVCLWGVGFNDSRHDTINSPSGAYSMYSIRRLVDFFKNDPEYGGCTVLLGVNYTWRTKTSRDYIDDHLFDIIRMADMINPWLVGRLKSTNDMTSFGKQIEADLLWCKNNGVEYMPCAFPGFSWLNMAFRDPSKSTNIISRDNGKFLWRQFETAVSKGVDQIYATMFDEIDEGTALFKVSNTPPNNINSNNEPNTTRVGEYPASVFQTIEGLPSDYYLWMVGEATRMLKKEISVTRSIPIRSDRFSLGGVTLNSEPLPDGKFKITYAGTVDGKLFCSKPYVVAYGAPSYGKTIDPLYFGTELTAEGVIVEGTAGQVVTVIRTDEENKAMGAGSVTLQGTSGLSRIKDDILRTYYDSARHCLIINSRSELTQSGTLSVHNTKGSEVFRKKLTIGDTIIQIPLNLIEGVYLIYFAGQQGNHSQKILVDRI